ncbi:hypothetical protein ACEPAH_9480 [Sanghuangporus vaninii]
MRFERLMCMHDLDESISLHRKALTLVLNDDYDCAAVLTNLANALWIRFEQKSQESDLQEAIHAFRRAQDIFRPEDPHYIRSLNGLGNALQFRGSPTDIEEAISCYRKALELSFPGSIESAQWLSNLSGALGRRYEITEDRDYLNESMECLRRALQTLPPEHFQYPATLINLTELLRLLFTLTGEMDFLEEMIFRNRAALDLVAPAHPFRPCVLSTIALSLFTRFERTHQIEDLDETIIHFHDALQLLPHGHVWRGSSLSHLGIALWTRFGVTRCRKDIEESITYHRDAVKTERNASFLNNLAEALQSHFRWCGRLESLEESISLLREVLQILPPESQVVGTVLMNLGVSLSLKVMVRETCDLEKQEVEEAVTCLRKAVELIPVGHQYHSGSLDNLARSLALRYHLTRQEEDLEGSIRCFRAATINDSSSIFYRLIAAKEWASVARSYRHESTLEAYRFTMELVESQLALTPTVTMQHNLLKDESRYSTFCSEAASHAIGMGHLELAVELLEHGRALLWSEMRGFRTSIDTLMEKNMVLANRFLRTSRELEALATTSPNAAMHTPLSCEKPPFDYQNITDQAYAKKRRLATELNEIKEEIRIIPGFENFLRNAPFETLRKAAAEGPVIIMNRCQFRSDIIILLYHQRPSCIPLPENFYVDTKMLEEELSNIRTEKGPDSQAYNSKLLSTLKSIWDLAVGRIVEELDKLGIEKNSRIWWCPTSILSALPLHAAARIITTPEGKKKYQYLSDIYVSSYTPTLTALIDAQSSTIGESYPDQPSRFLIVAQPDETLESVQEEVESICDVVKMAGRADLLNNLTGMAGNRDDVLVNLRDHSWVHFACHGHLSSTDPFQSSFQLYGNTRLTLLDISKDNIPNAELAFLSACHSAEQPAGAARDEVLHLAAAMQFSGFRSVIGTMWALKDEDGPFVAKTFYKYMLSEEKQTESVCERSARALNEAIRHLQKKAKKNYERWVNFIHIGACECFLFHSVSFT